MRPLLLLLPLLLSPFSLLFAQTPEIELEKGMVITQSARIKPKQYLMSAGPGDVFEPRTDNQDVVRTARPVVIIRGNNLTVDFQHADLRGSLDKHFPDEFYGLAILVEGRNITIKNARARGYKVALLADGADSLRLENCDFSYNYRPRLRSIREREDFSDWLSYHHNERDEWLRYGAGIYLRRCTGATVTACRITANQNALLLTGCTGATIYNNTFNFNSGLGLGLYRSSRNRVMHNFLDWNVRGYSHGFYQRGQDSAGILVYEQSNENLFAYNSATHSGDGFFLWAGQTTMDQGTGGCNDNVIFGNDFSHAPTNGIEVTFSRNYIAGNLLRECTHGIWGGYSYNTTIYGNLIADCRTGIAIEHGQNDTIRQNLFQHDSTGIHLWARAEQPKDWGYAQKRDTRSRDAVIDRNVFAGVRNPLRISASENVQVNGENLFVQFKQLLTAEKPNAGLKFLRNDVYATAAAVEAVWKNPELTAQRQLNFSHPDTLPKNPYQPLEVAVSSLREPDSLRGGMLAVLPPEHPRGRQYILVDEWGPYDFRRPAVFLEKIDTATRHYTFRLLGPAGRWNLVQTRGFRSPTAQHGTLPATLTVEREPGAEDLRLDFDFDSEAPVVTRFGETLPAGTYQTFEFRRFEKKLVWNVAFWPYTAAADPLKAPAAFDALLQTAPAATQTVPELAYAWWGAPAKGLPDDKFASVATAAFDIAPGTYVLELTSDDGARLYLDGRRLIEHWDIHEPATDEITVELGGRHTLRVEHFEAGGFGTLDLRVRPVR